MGQKNERGTLTETPEKPRPDRKPHAIYVGPVDDDGLVKVGSPVHRAEGWPHAGFGGLNIRALVITFSIFLGGFLFIIMVYYTPQILF